MNDLPVKSIFAEPLAVANVQTTASTCSPPPKPRSVPARIRSLVSKLGLRFAPSASADMDAHGARVALLAEDMADADPHLLELAIDRWVGIKPFLPKASELRALVGEIKNPRGGEMVNLADRYNERLIQTGSKLRWRYRDPTDLNSELYLSDPSPLVNKFASVR